MIKELKINFYRLIRTKSTIVISIILVVIALITAGEIKFCVDDPTGFVDGFSEGFNTAYAEVKVSSVEAENTGEIIGGSDETAELQLYDFFRSLRNTNSFDGVLRLLFYENVPLLLFALMAALFLGAEYKSRFHVNRYSVNTSPCRIVLGELFSLFFAALILEVVCYAITLSGTYALCNSFHRGDLWLLTKYAVVLLFATMMFMSFAYMIAYIRRASALSIVLSTLFVSQVFDLVFMLGSIIIKPLKYFAVATMLSEMLLYTEFSLGEWISLLVVMILYIGIFLGTTLAVAAKRDAY